MIIEKKRLKHIFLILLIVTLLSIPVLASTAYFYWYDAGGAKCKTTTKGTAENRVYKDNFPFIQACCDVAGTTQVKYCGAGLCKTKNAYYINWDANSGDCTCYGKTWVPGKTFDSGKPSCCGDDSGEYYRTRECTSWCTTEGSDDGCCGATNKCVYTGGCYNSGGCYLDDAYCDEGNWYDSDSGESYCDTCVGVDHWSIGGDIAETTCCSDDAGEYYRTRGCASWCTSSTEDKACCEQPDTCVQSNTCYDSGSCLSGGYCAAGIWYDVDNATDYCTACIGEGYWDLDGQYESKKYACCGDDAGEYKVVVGKGNETKNGACCDNENDCMTISGHCQSEYPKEVTCDLDGKDNDCDGKTDCSDPDCTPTNACIGCPPEDCTNEVDDDCDSLIDCEDSDCIGEIGCEHCFPEDCTNEIDDDCDNRTDCEDADCMDLGIPACETCIDEICDNGVDDDCDGFIDYSDWGCGCPLGTTLCLDNTCSNQCDIDDTDVQGCITPNDVCEEGEGCACDDCVNEKGACYKYSICMPFYNLCGCAVGTKLCDDGYCRQVCGECGNGIIDPGEECDKLGPVFGENLSSCNDIDEFTGGILACDDNCYLDTSSCEGGSTGVCGDETVNVGEICDSLNFDGKECSNFGFEFGELYCFEPGHEKECHFNTGDCYDISLKCVDDDYCDFINGEDCTCEDCLGEQATCSYGAVCDVTGGCACEDGKTLCGDGSCRIQAECETLPECNNNSICDNGEGCDCPDCEGQQASCKSGSACLDGVCTSCSILNVYWTEDCIGCKVVEGVSMVAEGTPGCHNKLITFDLWEDEFWGEENVEDPIPNKAIFDNTGRAELSWTPEEEGTFYFKALIKGEEFESPKLEVIYCIPECDVDCDRYCDSGKVRENGDVLDNDCQNALDTEGTTAKNYCETEEGNIKIDANALTGWCEIPNSEGLGFGQETCAAYYDCTPDWWIKEGVEYPGPGSASEASSNLEWDECEETEKGIIRTRKICPDKDNCCTSQANCYCKFPTDMPGGLDCTLSQYKPSTEKTCLAEEKFPFFTNMNILVVILILIGFYTWKTKKNLH